MYTAGIPACFQAFRDLKILISSPYTACNLFITSSDGLLIRTTKMEPLWLDSEMQGKEYEVQDELELASHVT